jgi:hypothetical protein
MKIIVNGREYAGPEHLPPDVRAHYERAMSTLADRNGNGIPDILEMQPGQAGGKTGDPPVRIVTSQKLVINGRQYDSVEQMPAEDRRLLEEIQGVMAQGDNTSAQPAKDGVTIPAHTSGGEPGGRQLDPLDPAQWTPRGGILATDPVTMMFLGMVAVLILFAVVAAIMGVMR